MRRRSFLTVTAAATALGFAGCVQEPGDRGAGETKTSPGDGGPGSQSTDTADGPDTPDETPIDGPGESAQAWGTSGRMNGTMFSFTSQGPETGEDRDEAEIARDDDTDEVIVDGTISGSDTCKRAKLGSVEYDESAGTLVIDVETTTIDDCEMGGQALVHIDYEGTFEVDGDLPSEIQVTHDGRSVAGASYASESAAAATTTDST